MSSAARRVLQVGKETVEAVAADRVPTLAAAMTYYTFFSVAPLVIIAVAIAGSIFGEQAARGEISRQLVGLLGVTASKAVEDLVKGASAERSGLVATLLGVVGIIFGATGLFTQLQEALNIIWKAPPLKIHTLLGMVRARLLSLVLVLCVGLCLLVLLLVSVALDTLCEWVGRCGPVSDHWINEGISFGVSAALFGLVFKLLPDIKVSWRDVWVGAAVTALLFAVGKHILGFVLGRTALLQSYGPAASLAAFLLWVHFSSLTLLFGAELSHVIATHDPKAGPLPRDRRRAPPSLVPAP